MDDGPPPAVAPDAPVPPVTWRNRRKMAWIAFWVILIGNALALYCGLVVARTERQIALVESLYEYLVMVCGAVICAYMGFTTLPFIGRNR
jgi:hypothetical protein